VLRWQERIRPLAVPQQGLHGGIRTVSFGPWSWPKNAWTKTVRTLRPSNDRQTEIKTQKPNPTTVETSKPRMSTMIPPLGLASAAPLTGCQRKVGCRRAARAGLIAQRPRIDQGQRDRHDERPRVSRVVALFRAANSIVVI
jgi:hypothetical protein